MKAFGVREPHQGDSAGRSRELRAHLILFAHKADCQRRPAKASRVDQLESELSEFKSHAAEGIAAVASSEKWPKIDLHVLGSVNLEVSSEKDERKQFELGDIEHRRCRAPERTCLRRERSGRSFGRGRFRHRGRAPGRQLQVNDNFNLDVSRFHTAIGWYNNFYHNGTYFQPAKDRPEPFLFEDNGGFPSGSANLSYSFEVANGGNFFSGSVQSLIVADDNTYKSVNFQLWAKPDGPADRQFLSPGGGLE